MENLTAEEQNAIKDILKAIGRDDSLNRQFARAVGMTTMHFNAVADSIFKKMENGRITFDNPDGNKLI